MRLPVPQVIAEDFWEGLPFADAFPRKIEEAIAFRLPLALVKLPALSVNLVRDWLHNRQIRAEILSTEMELMGCLYAFGGHGIIFISDGDALHEQRLSIAHEVAHFLVDYLLPRYLLIQVLGEKITQVLDGARNPNPAERANAVLNHIRIGVHAFLLPRNDSEDELKVLLAEDRAYRVALELMAPESKIRQLLSALLSDGRLNEQEVCRCLSDYFGLPEYVFAIMFRKKGPKVTSFTEDVRLSLKKGR